MAVEHIYVILLFHITTINGPFAASTVHNAIIISTSKNTCFALSLVRLQIFFLNILWQCPPTDEKRTIITCKLPKPTQLLPKLSCTPFVHLSIHCLHSSLQEAGVVQAKSSLRFVSTTIFRDCKGPVV